MEERIEISISYIALAKESKKRSDMTKRIKSDEWYMPEG